MNLLEFTDRGIHCPPGGFYIDPWQSVDYAVLTHAHADHARRGSRHYLAHRDSEPVLRLRLGADIQLRTVDYGEEVRMNGVKVSLHPAGHIYGSAQVRVEHRGEVWVASGDYKLEDDGVSAPFEPVPCHSFVTESTFGLPIYQWKPPSVLMEEINGWWRENRDQGKASVLFGYSLGKAQRILRHLDAGIGEVFLHGAIWNVHQALIEHGLSLPDAPKVTAEIAKRRYPGSLILAPPSAAGTTWLRKFGAHATGAASGWMNLRGAKRRKAVDRGFVVSDHADWPGLNAAVAATGASRVYVTHGYQAAFARYLRDRGLEAYEVNTLFEGESDEAGAMEALAGEGE
ncbi:MAG: ligase-associated DNA damage response exonuclease [Ferruginibacter sp.]|nr:ligase-associated DNA damage response exonuclease [Cytophagales bacterium]